MSQFSCRLGDVAEIVMGQSPAGDDCNKTCNGLPLLNGPTEFGDHHPVATQFTTDPKKRAKPADLLFCVRGSTTGRMNWADKEYAIGRGIAAIRHKDGADMQPLLRATIEYYLPQLLQSATGSTFPNVSGVQLAKVPYPNLDWKEQHATSRLFGALSDKIELNRRMNDTLEASAAALFRDWFVDFGPTRAKAEDQPEYLASDLWCLFPDRLGENGVPEGWESGTLADIANIQNGFAFSSKDWKDDGVPVVKIGSVKPGLVDLNQPSFVSPELAASRANFRLAVGDMLIGLTGYVGETGFVPPSPCLPMLNQRVGRVVPKSGTAAYAFCALRDQAFKDFAILKSHGSAQANVSTRSLLEYAISLPSADVMTRFQDAVIPLFDQILRNYGENRDLAETRDTLLPKLMSGEIRVRDAEALAA